jgi:hypothetical protein
MTDWLWLAVPVALFVLVVVRYAREEERKNRAFIASLEAMSRRCPDCGGMGWHFGPPGTGDPAISTPTCTTCKDAGELERVAA